MTSIRILIFVVGLLACLSLENQFPRRRLRHSRGARFLFHATLACLNTALIRFIGIAPLFYLLEEVKVAGYGLIAFLGIDGAVEIVVSLVLLDLAYYFWHRMSHEFSWFWAFHKVHHSDTDLDVYTSLRIHPGEFLLSYVFKAAAIALIGPSILSFAIYEMISTFAMQFHHSNLEFKAQTEALLRRFIVTPRVHLAHHAVTSQEKNGNYAATFLIWDHLFRTFKRPEFENLTRVGFEGGRDQVLNFFFQLKAPFQKELG